MVKKQSINLKGGFKRITIALAVGWFVLIMFIGFSSVPKRPTVFDPDKYLANKGVKVTAREISEYREYDLLKRIKTKKETYIVVDKESPQGSLLPLDVYLSIVFKYLFSYFFISLIGSGIILGVFFLFSWIAEGFKK